MLSQKLKSTEKLNRTELKNVIGGNDQSKPWPPVCLLKCDFDENGISFGCPVNQHCVEYLCNTHVYATKCVA